MFKNDDSMTYRIGIACVVIALLITITQTVFTVTGNGDFYALFVGIVAAACIAIAWITSARCFYEAEQTKKLYLAIERINAACSLLNARSNAGLEHEFIYNRADLYTKMRLAALSCATHPHHAKWEISATSFLPKSPEDDSEIQEIKDYHTALKQLYSERQIYIRRIVSVPTKNKYEWVKQQVNTYKNCERFSIRWHVPSSKTDRNVVIPFNIQIYGDSHLFIIAPKINHVDGGDDREIHVYMQSAEMVEPFRQYYQQIWAGSQVRQLLDDGNIRPEFMSELEAHQANLPN